MQKQESFMCSEINFVLGKNGGHMPSSLGGRLIVVVRLAGKQAGRWVGELAGGQAGRQADTILAIYKIFKI